MTTAPTPESSQRDPAGSALSESDRASTNADRARYTLAEQIACAERELGWRYRVYAGRVRDGKMSEAERDREIGLMRAIRNTLRAIRPHEDTIRAVIVHARDRERMIAEAAELGDHPAVIAVQSEFPGAEIVSVREARADSDFAEPAGTRRYLPTSEGN